MDLKLMVLLIIGVVGVAIVLSVMAAQMGSDYEETAQAVGSVSVSLAFLGVALLALTDSKAPKGSCVLFAGFAGVIYAFIMKSLYDNGILVDEFIGGSITMPDLMTMIVILWILIGMIMEVVRA